MSKQKWSHSSYFSPIAETGDYDAYIQFTNGKDILQTSGDELEEEDLQKFCDLLDCMPDLWSHTRDYLEFENSQNNKKINYLKNALEQISNPIKYIQNNLKEGEQINGQYAIQISNDPNYLKSIAKNSLNEVDQMY